MNSYDNRPVRVKGEFVWRTYTGGRELAAIHGEIFPADSHFPEEWMFSVTRAFNSGREDVTEGLCRLADEPEVTLQELIQREPEHMLGRKHMKAIGNTPGVLIKLIDSEERLTVQVHPDKEKAGKLFHSEFGKTECWHILSTRKDAAEPPCLYLGFKKGITREAWMECFYEQDYDKMLGLMNRMEVSTGETYLVQGGVPHAIGAGCLILEIQEPTDYTIRVERVTPSGFCIADEMCHQGLGFDKMFDCFSYEGYSGDEIREYFQMKGRTKKKNGNICRELVGYKDTGCFRILKMEILNSCELEGEDSFSCLYVLSGSGRMAISSGSYSVSGNDQFFIPAHCEKYCIINDGREKLEILFMYGPEAV